MATTTSISNFDPALKQIYSGSNLADLTYKTRPLMGMLNKFTQFGGRNMPVVLEYSNPQGRSRQLSEAINNATEVKVEDFVVTRVSDYAVATIDGEAIEATRGDRYAFLSALRAKVDGAVNALSNSIETKLFRDGSGYLAQIASESTTTTTLTRIEESTLFEVNMEVQAAASTTGSLRTGSATITGINRTTGVLTSDSNWTSQITSYAANDYLFVDGDGQDGGSSPVCIAGLEKWFPSTPGTLFGVTQSTDSRLYGLYHDGSGGEPLEETLIDAQSKAAREGGAPGHCFVHHAQYRILNKELGAKREYTEVNATMPKGISATIAYSAIQVQGDQGVMKIIAANKCQANKAWCLTMSTNKLCTLGEPVQRIDADGLMMLRQTTADAYESRWRFRGNFVSKAPIYNVHVNLANP